ncbi:MAG TPA: PDZ domain-containing protein [Gemmataceae bacterium]
MNAPRRRFSRRLLTGLGVLGLATFLPLAAWPGQQATPQPQPVAKVRAQPGQLNGDTLPLPADWVKSFTWRSIGPANMGGRITALAVYEADPSIYYVATASGGLLKTVNNGVTFEHQFDKENSVSIGAVCVAPSDRDVVWVGTGEANPRNSVSYGDGVYKSTDGGKTWKHMGLKESFQIGDIVIHPKNPDIVYVGALGRLYGPNEERGLFKTTDGGKTWDKVLYVDENTGVIDIAMDPSDPETLLVAMWERRRDEFDSFLGARPPDGVETYGPVVTHSDKSGIYRTTDGGKTFQKITEGLPSCKLGRIGLDFYRKDPKIVYAVVDSEKHGMGDPQPDVYMGISGEDSREPRGARVVRVTEGGPSEKAGLREGEVVVAWGGKKVAGYEEMIEEFLYGQKAGDTVKLTVRRGGEEKEVELTIGRRPERQGPPSLGARPELAPGPVKLAEVEEGGAAAKAGLKAGDVILRFGGTPVDDARGLFQLLREHEAGEKVEVRYRRGEDEKTAEVVLQPGQARPGAGGRPQGDPRRPYAASLAGQRENVMSRQGKIGPETGGVYRSGDGGKTWERVNSLNPRPMYFSVVRVDPTDANIVYVLGVQLHLSTDGGKRFRNAPQRGVHADHHALWIDPEDGRHLILGTDGGLYVSYDRGAHWDHHNHMAMGQYYHVTVDNRRPYNVYGGLQDNGSWGGPSHTLRGGGPINEDWIFVNGGDGFVCRVDPTDPDLVYSESQNGSLSRRHLKTGERRSISVRPPQPPRGPRPEGGAKGEAKGEAEGGPEAAVEGEKEGEVGPQRRGGQQDRERYRFNWNTPFILSHHNPSILYVGGNFVFRSLNRGDDWKKISPEITRTSRGSATALAESPLNPDVLWVGTDDGALWVSRDGGQKWENVAEKVGLPGPRWVASIEASRAAEGRAYVAFDAHRSDDDNPYVYVTEDFGQTWTSLRSNLPTGSTRVLREDLRNPDLLYLGTEFACYASTNRGQWWTKLNNNLPTVAVHEFAQPETANEIVAATHGRSLWVLDVTALRQMTPKVLARDAELFRPSPVVRWRLEPGRTSPYSASARKFAGENPSGTAELEFFVRKPTDKLSLKVLDYAGRTVREWDLPGKPGFRRVSWDLRVSEPRQRGQGGPGGAGARAGGGRRGGPPTRPAEPGMYRVVLDVGGKELAQPLVIEPDPNHPGSAFVVDEEPEGEEEESPVIDD